MQRDAPPEAITPDAGDEPARLIAQSRRFTVVMVGVVALGIVASAWYVGGRQGFAQIGRGGLNLTLLPKIGDPAPDFVTTVVDHQGRPVARVPLSAFRSRPVWLNFWGSWCPPCRSEMPEIQAAYEQLQPNGLVWLAVSLDEPATDAASFAARNGATFLIASDQTRADTGVGYPIANFPTHILIDRDGIVRDIVLAAIDEKEIVERAHKIMPNEHQGDEGE